MPAGSRIGPDSPAGFAWRATATVLGIAVVAGAVVWAVANDRPPQVADPGAAAAEAFVREYVAALNGDDPVVLAALLGEAADGPEVVGRLERFGGLALRDVHVSLVNEFPRIYRVNVLATSATGGAVTIAEVIEWTGTRWHVAPLTDARP